MGLLDLAVKVLEDEKLRKSLVDGIDSFFSDGKKNNDTPKEGEYTQSDFETLMENMRILVSLWGQAALADGKISDEEEDLIDRLIELVIFTGDGTEENSPVLPSAMLEKFGKKKKDLKRQYCALLINPYSLEKIVEFSTKNDIEENAYENACRIIGVDKVTNELEMEFLIRFSSMLDISSIGKKRIEREHLGKVIGASVNS